MQIAQKIGIAGGMAVGILGMLLAVIGMSWGSLHLAPPAQMLQTGDVAAVRHILGAAHRIEQFQQASMMLVCLGLATTALSMSWSLRKP
jgi:hypothetical protein